MTKIHIVTDSSAVFAHPRVAQQYAITIIPNKFNIGGKVYREGVDLTQEELLRLVAAQRHPPQIIPPTTAEFAAAYTQAARSARTIVSVHISREITASWQNARLAARQLAGMVEIAVIDSRTLCVGQGMLVRLGAQAIQDGADFETVVQLVRGAAERVYSVFYVESLEFLLHNHIMSESRTLLAAVLGIKPFLSIEDGRLIVTEKVRTRAQATERLIEFLSEFEDLDDAAIIQNRPHITEQTRSLQDRLAVEFPGRHFPGTQYGTTLAALVGPDATGIVILEREGEEYDGS